MLDLWYSEEYDNGAKLSIKVKRHLHSEKSPFQQIDFFDSDIFGRFFTLDGLMMVTEKDEFAYHDMICHPAFAVNPDIKRVLIIGGGDGGTARECSRYKNVQRIDMVEIDERVVRLCQKYLPLTASILDNDNRIHLYFQDGLEFIKKAPPNEYDLILVDSTDPIGHGEGLFTIEFYNNCYRILKDNGILINQHESAYYESFAKAMQKAHNKISSVFPKAFVYQLNIPTYPSGYWLFGFSSKKFHPINDLKKEQWDGLNIDTKYYNTNLHTASFALPTYVINLLNEAKTGGIIL